MRLQPRYEVHDFRDPERRQQAQQPWNEPHSESLWSKAFRIMGGSLFVGLTMYNLYIIGGWLSNWYAKKRAAATGHWKRSRFWKRRVIDMR